MPIKTIDVGLINDHKRLHDYLAHIAEAILKIESYVEEMDEVSFLGSPITQDAVLRNIEIIGEASNNIIKKFPSFSNSHPEIPFAIAYQMRNAVSHGYFKVDLEIVWKTISNDLPSLYQCVLKAIESLDG